MPIEIITKEEFEAFQNQVFSRLQELKELVEGKGATQKQWLKSKDVMKMLNISAGKLQMLRDNGTIPYKSLEGTMFYSLKDIEKMLTK